MKKIIITLICFLLSTTIFAENYTKLSSNDRITLPRDMYFKENFASQWWYLTGHLESEGGQRFGYQFTIFAVNVNKKKYKSAFGLNRLYISHFAITDINNNKYYYSQQISRGSYGAAEAAADKLNVHVYDNSLKGTIKQMDINAKDQNFSIALDLKSEKKPVLNGDKGYSNKNYGCSECASLYFSLTDLSSKGIINIKGRNYKVNGKSWFDREINSDYNTNRISGWDWFSIMLDDNREIMIYRIRDKNGKINRSSYATIVDKKGNKETVNFEKISFEKLDFFKSESTKSKYPVSWQIKIPQKDIDIKITPYVKKQEFMAGYTTFNNYWEGACKVTGSHEGKAYVELTGY